ncbi:hypothetical protein GCM10009850_092540 [Nonomuraea monospora]|uniref:Uncharacterized protein n=1 Tax=Nonomuraea monospora TaxID=568818 RepID=A0ABP5PQ74_9ACTN
MPAAEPQDRQWHIALLPAIPSLLLMLRIWYFSHESVDNAQLIVQHINPIGLITALLLTVLWLLPAATLGFRLAGSLLRLSVDEPLRFRVARLSTHIPGWVLGASMIVAALTWEIQFLPILLSIVLILATVELQLRFPTQEGLVATCTSLAGAGAIVVFYVFTWPLAQEAMARQDVMVILLGLLPPLALLVNGPLPSRVAPWTTTAVASLLALSLAAIVVLEFVRIPILPVMAVEVGDGDGAATGRQVLSGYVITMDEQMTTFLDLRGALHFVTNDSIVSKTLCRDYSRAPYTDLAIRGHRLEQSVLETSGPDGLSRAVDQRCYGRTR